MRRTAGRSRRSAVPWPACRVALGLMAMACLAPPIAAGPVAEAAAPTAVPPVPASASQAAIWPRTLQHDGASVTIYQPQAIAWPDRKRLTARAAVAIIPKGATRPMLGTVELSFATTVDAEAGLVRLADPQLISTHFPALDTARAAALQTKLTAALPAIVTTRAVPLAAVDLSLGRVPVAPVKVDNTPPAIFTASRPASLVVFDGKPVLAPVGKTGLSAAVNTNWDVFETGGAWYLLADGIWLSAPEATGPYHAVAQLPAAFGHLPETADFAELRKAIPPHKPKSAALVPTIFVSTTPAEIIVTQGPPKFVPVAGTGLQRVENTAAALFFDPGKGRFYVLFSGRWFAAAGLDGPWRFATDDLPPDFALIPPQDPAAAVLPAVPGTVEAEEAVLKAQIPTTATVARGSVHPDVAYSGAPRFEPIPGTTLLYAVNTQAVVLKAGHRYHVCQNGVWFAGAAPTGPWQLAASLPPAIATIPPSFPFYNVTYVQVYGATPAAVTYGYTTGYLMGFVSAGVLVYGTGYYYPPVIWPGRVPIYYPYPYTYAGGVYYNPRSGVWARGGTVYGPYATATGGRYYNPTTGTWAAGGAIYGPNGGAGAWSVYNPRTGSYAHGSAAWGNGSGSAQGSFYNARTGISGTTSQNRNPYQRWGSSTISGPNQTVSTRSQSSARGSAGGFTSSTGAAGVGYHNKATGNSGAVVKGQGGNVYAGRDGNVYRHTDSGWQNWSNGSWNQVQPPSGAGRSGAAGNSQASTSLGAGKPGSAAGTGATASRGARQTRPTQTRPTQTRPTQTRPNQTRATQTRPTQAPASRAAASRPGTASNVSRGDYQQLQRDYLAREGGDRRLGGGAGRGGGWRR